MEHFSIINWIATSVMKQGVRFCYISFTFKFATVICKLVMQFRVKFLFKKIFLLFKPMEVLSLLFFPIVECFFYYYSIYKSYDCFLRTIQTLSYTMTLVKVTPRNFNFNGGKKCINYKKKKWFLSSLYHWHKSRFAFRIVPDYYF